MEDDCLDDTEFYDGLEEDPGRPYPALHLPAWLAGAAEADVPAPEPKSARRLMTPEEFRAAMAAEGIILPGPQ